LKYLRSTTAGCKDIGIKLYDLVEFIVINFLKQWSIRNLSSPTFFLINVPVRRLYQSDVCTSPTFVPVRRLYWSDVCASDVCTVRRLCVRRLYWYQFLRVWGGNPYISPPPPPYIFDYVKPSLIISKLLSAAENISRQDNLPIPAGIPKQNYKYTPTNQPTPINHSCNL